MSNKDLKTKLSASGKTVSIDDIPVNSEDLRSIDAKLHVTGKSLFVDDIPMREGTLHAAVYGSEVAKGKIKSIDLDDARKSPGVVAIYTAKDIPGENQVGGIIPDEPLMADGHVTFNGMPIALVVAETEMEARRALKKIKVDIETEDPIVEPRDAFAKKSFIMPSRTFSIGDTKKVWDECEHVFEEQASMGGQEHLYIETQGSYSLITENDNIKVYSSTQSISYVQKAVSMVLGLPMHKIEVDVTRLGGGFGGKEDGANHWGALASLATYFLKRPVKLILHREDDMRMTGKRHPYDFDIKIGLSKDYKILGYEVICYQNAGAAADLSPAIMERSLFHGAASYFIPNVKITVHSCKTNLPPNTAFRGFGAPQAMFAMESAIYNAAAKLGVDFDLIQRRNLLKEGDEFPYGQKATQCNAEVCFDTAVEKYELQKLKKEIADFNSKNQTHKKGLAVFPLCFGISFTNKSLNQASALVHIYKDGSVIVSTGVVEMGQAVYTKLLGVAKAVLGLKASRIKIDSTNTSRTANVSPTAASSGADLNGKAVEMATTALRDRLYAQAAKILNCQPSQISICEDIISVDGKVVKLTWEKLILEALIDRVNLSEHSHYTTPSIYFDKTKEKGEPFAYHAYGTAITVVKLDCLRGVYEVEQAKIVHDFGRSINLHIDKGQVEGALMQGIGLMTIEELIFNPDGSLRSNSLSSYKVPDIYSAPKTLEIIPLDKEGPKAAIFGSKAVGEPPLCYGIGTYFAVTEAMRAFNPNYKLKFQAPLTFQKCLLDLYDGFKA